MENGAFLETVLFTKVFKKKNLDFINQIDSKILFEGSEKEMKEQEKRIKKEADARKNPYMEPEYQKKLLKE